jgi:hypothetical protein
MSSPSTPNRYPYQDEPILVELGKRLSPAQSSTRLWSESFTK